MLSKESDLHCTITKGEDVRFGAELNLPFMIGPILDQFVLSTKTTTF